MMDEIIAGYREARRVAADGEESKDLLGLLLSMVDERPFDSGEEVRITETDVKALILVSSRFQCAHVVFKQITFFFKNKKILALLVRIVT
jgi:hypothetical protein